ncbi:hypothetical protein VNO77_24489 [Canavalia gladiata]|uniref:Flavonoid 3'-monooxygenase n=1 Tax=Canavalia gladiata TaxID=3824 RepID=A0AAN9L6W6_CANGL
MSPWLIGFATIVAAILIYRLVRLIHGPSLPLPPGPRPWPIVGNLPHMGPMPHNALATLARIHGPLMHLRLGFVDVVIAGSASVAEQFLKVHDANFSSRPTNPTIRCLSYNNRDFTFAPYGPRWRLLRKISSVHLLSGKALDQFRHVRQEEVARLAHNLASSDSKAVNLGQKLNICTTNALGRVMIGRRVFNDGNDSSDPSANEFKSMVLDLMALLGAFNINNFIPALEWLDFQRVQAKTEKLHKRFDAFFTTILEEHKISKSEKHQDLLSTMLSLKEAPEGGDKLTDAEIKASLSLLVAILAHAFDWEIENGLGPEKLNMDEAYGFTMQRAVPLLVHPRPRLSPHVYSSSSSP